MQINAARFCRGDSSAMEKPYDLRRLAEWYRSFAPIDHSAEREWRLKLADYLDLRAVELERSAKREEGRSSTARCSRSSSIACRVSPG
jgi:hypothetical protein